MPKNSMFADKGPAILNTTNSGEMLLTLLAVLNSKAFVALASVQVARVSLAQSYEIGIIQTTPIPILDEATNKQLAKMARDAWSILRELDSTRITSSSFTLPALITGTGRTLAERAIARAEHVRTSEEAVAVIQEKIDDLVFNLYGLDPANRAALTSTFDIESIGDAAIEAGEDEEDEVIPVDTTALVADIPAYSLGCAFGQWDIRYATGERIAPQFLDPFAPLPVCPPSQLQNAQGLPVHPVDAPTDYPINNIPWDGILVDDEGHERNIVSRVSNVIEIIWKGRAEAIEQEVCGILGVKSLREYFRKPTGFFADHLNRYTKSKRKAPIYWPLSSANGLYTVWLYYHRLNADTLFTVLRDHVKPKLEFEERRAFEIRQEAGQSPSASQIRDIAEAEELVEDLRAFKAELENVAPLFHPNLNDGVIINYAPLWRLIGLPKWRKDCQSVWNELIQGDYDWAHLALHLWPERVIPKCAKDHSLAIAHGLDEIFWQKDPESPGKWLAVKVPAAKLNQLIAERTSPAVKAALETLTTVSNGAGVVVKRKTIRKN